MAAKSQLKNGGYDGSTFLMIYHLLPNTIHSSSNHSFSLSLYFLQAPKKGKGKSKGASKCERGVENKNRHTIRSSTNHHRTEVADNRETLESFRWLYSTTRTDGCEAFPFSLIFILRVPISPLLSAASQRQPTSPPLFYHTKWQMGGGRGEAEVSMMA